MSSTPVGRLRIPRVHTFCHKKSVERRPSSLCGSTGERQLAGIRNDLIQQLPDRLPIAGDDRKLITEAIGRRAKPSSILRATTP
jgi:hypothetical protein